MSNNDEAAHGFHCHGCGHTAAVHVRGCTIEGCKCPRYPSGIYSECLEAYGYIVIGES